VCCSKLSPFSSSSSVLTNTSTGHVINFSDKDFLQTILRDLTKLRKTFHPTMVIDSMELICGNSYSLEKAEQVISGGWALDPVHPTKHIYAKTALNLMEKVANKRDSPISPQTSNTKRTWSGSNRRISGWIRIREKQQDDGEKQEVARSKEK
jgi:hypothetical protein